MEGRLDMGWRREEVEATGCSSFLFVPLLLLLTSAAADSAAGTVSVRPTPVASGAAAGTVPTVEGWCPKLEDERIGPPWWGHGSESECELEDGETEEASGTGSLTNQQLLGAAGYISYRSLEEDSAQCQKRGNCRPTAASPTPYTRCTGWCRRGDSPIDAAAYY